jgi:hypothetical protein
MMMVRFILVEMTRPERIRPRIDTSPVKGHFLSAITFNYTDNQDGWDRRTDVGAVDGLSRGLEAKTDVLIPSLLLGDFLAG